MRGLAAAACFAGTVLFAPALASDFTLHVPVHVENLHSATRIFVNCSIVSTGGTVATANVPSGIPLVGGAYDGTVTLTMNATDLASARSATAYRCQLLAQATNSHTGEQVTMILAAYGAPTTPFSGYTDATGQTLSSVQGFVTGPLH